MAAARWELSTLAVIRKRPQATAIAKKKGISRNRSPVGYPNLECVGWFQLYTIFTRLYWSRQTVTAPPFASPKQGFLGRSMSCVDAL